VHGLRDAGETSLVRKRSRVVKQMHLGVFEVLGPQVGGTFSWPHHRSASSNFTSLDHWVHIAKVIDAAGFTFLFLADTFGYPTVDGELAETAARRGINFPTLDPSVIVTALARETERLGFVVTSPTGLDHPVQSARRFATLDHFTDGRIGWNIVTGSAQNVVAELFGHTEMMLHDERYAMADEYIDAALNLWEGSWEDDALIRDREAGLYADPTKIHKVTFEGRYFRSSGYFASPPSPQRTPVLFQAGTSERGRAFAARNAEAVFVQATTMEKTAEAVADIRAKAVVHGRDPRSVKTIIGVSVMVAPTHHEAVARRWEFEQLQSDEIVAALYSHNTGINLLELDRDGTLEQALGKGAAGQTGQTNITRFMGGDGKPAMTVREVLDELRGRGTRGFAITGDPVEVADELERILDATDLDGFMLEPIFEPSDVEEFVELVVPILRERGRLPAAPARGTLREQLSGSGSARLAADHPGVVARL
jgi:FMN-dependent oxidoreductase (nitrilotriacetate monooxygenase family)